MQPPDFIAVYRVVQPIAKPILALPGLILTVWPRSETRTLAVCAPGPRRRLLRHCGVAPGLLYGMVMEWEDAGIIAPFSEASSLASWSRSA